MTQARDFWIAEMQGQKRIVKRSIDCVHLFIRFYLYRTVWENHLTDTFSRFRLLCARLCSISTSSMWNRERQHDRSNNRNESLCVRFVAIYCKFIHERTLASSFERAVRIEVCEKKSNRFSSINSAASSKSDSILLLLLLLLLMQYHTFEIIWMKIASILIV